MKKGMPHGPGTNSVEREARTTPIAATAQFAELIEDAGLVLFLPRPDAPHQFVPTQIMPGFAFLRANPFLDNRLGADAGVIGAGHPEHVVTLHAPPANQH